MAENCPYFKTGKCALSPAGSQYDCSWSFPTYDKCNVYSMNAVAARGGSMADQLRAIGALSHGAEVTGGRKSAAPPARTPKPAAPKRAKSAPAKAAKPVPEKKPAAKPAAKKAVKAKPAVRLIPVQSAPERVLGKTKNCPHCGKQVEAASAACQYCGAKFQVAFKGYCQTEHAVGETNAKGVCLKCGREALDKWTESTLVEAPAPEEEPQAAAPTAAAPEAASTKKCPLCAETIKAEAKLCRYCRAIFEVTITGYCTNCHKVVTVNAEDKCSTCGGEVIDRKVDSKFTGRQTPQPPQVRPAAQAAPAVTPARPSAAPVQPADNITRLRRWFVRQEGRPIKVNVVSKLGDHWDTVTSAHGKLVAIEEHPTQKGIFRMEFDSRLRGSENDAVMLGFEVSGIAEQGDQLIIYKGLNQHFELTAGVEPPKVETPPEADWPKIAGYGFQCCSPCGGKGTKTCKSCEGYGKILVQEPARRCPVCRGMGYLIEREIYLGPMCTTCRGTGWQNALKYSEAVAQARKNTPPAAPKAAADISTLVTQALEIIERVVQLRAGGAITVGGSESEAMNAARKLGEAHGLRPEDPWLHYAYASALHLAMQYETGRKEVEKLAGAQPNFPLARLALEGWEAWDGLFLLPPWGQAIKSVHPVISAELKAGYVMATREGLRPRATLFLRDAGGDFASPAVLQSARIDITTVVSDTRPPLAIVYARIWDNPGSPFQVEALGAPTYPRGHKQRCKFEYLCLQEDIDFAVISSRDQILLNKRLPMPARMKQSHAQLLKLLQGEPGRIVTDPELVSAVRTFQSRVSLKDIRY